MLNDLLKTLDGKIDLSIIDQERNIRSNWLKRPSLEKYYQAIETFSPRLEKYTFNQKVVSIGRESTLSPEEKTNVSNLLKTFMPWRKGPFRFFGIDIDAEWKSDLKFERILPHLDDLKDASIADIGANNGYFMFRLAHYSPKAIIAFEPTAHYKILFDYFNSFTGLNRMQFELLGGEHLIHFHRVFDIVLCLGVLYHHRDPIGMLRGIWESLKADGQVIIESQGIPGEGSYCLFPKKRYGKVPGTWFIPTADALINWMSRSGFKEIELFHKHPMSSSEQRKTPWMTYESYEDFIDANNPQKTVEGYPAPWRFYVKARKRLG